MGYEVKINEFEALLYQKDVDKPIIYKGENFCYLKRKKEREK